MSLALLIVLALGACSHPPRSGADASSRGSKLADTLVRYDEMPAQWFVPESWDQSRHLLFSPGSGPFGPDPFNECRFYVADSAPTTIYLHNLMGTCIDTLVNRELPRGFYLAITEGWELLTSGVFFYRVTIGDYTKVAKAISLK